MARRRRTAFTEPTEFEDLWQTGHGLGATTWEYYLGKERVAAEGGFSKKELFDAYVQKKGKLPKL
jgi:hypothetical protein